MNKPFKSYYGGKNGPGTFQTIINQLKPHERLIIPFAGNCGIAANIKNCDQTILIDQSKKVIEAWQQLATSKMMLLQTCGINYLEAFSTIQDKKKTVIYCDPPYPISSRKGNKEIYKHELSDADHLRLLSIIKNINCDVLISTYKNEMYSEALKDWNCIEFQSWTRRGKATELLYMNYKNDSGELHDYRYIGKDHRERERIRQKIKRHINKLKRLNKFERNAILSSWRQ